MSSDVALPSSESNMTPPTPAFATSDRPISRPLSEISDNSDRRRSVARSVKGEKGEKRSRPNSEVMEADNNPRRLSGSIPIQTLTVNLVDYAAGLAKGPAPMASTAPPPPSPSTKPIPMKTEKAAASAARPASAGPVRGEKGKEGPAVKETRSKDAEESSGVSSLFMAKRASLRPSPLGATYADVLKPMPSPTLSTTSQSSFDSAASSSDLPSKPSTKSKPSWLRRASGTAALRSKTRSPAPKEEEANFSASTSLPPVLPPRKGGFTNSTTASLPSQARNRASMPPPEVPSKSSYANVAVAGPSRSRLGDGQGRPAFSPPLGPPIPSRENVGNIRGRLAAWTAAAQSTTSLSLPRSGSSASLSSTSAPSSFTQTAQPRIPSSAQRVLGQAGSAVQKGWAGLRARGVGGSISGSISESISGSISGMSSLNPSSRRGPLEPSESWASGLARGGSRDHTQSENDDLEPNARDGPIFQEGVMLRAGGNSVGRVFGRDLVEAGRTWSVVEATVREQGASEWEQRRRRCLPALVIRAVEYLEIWGPKEEGIFRISGRSSHIVRVRKEFDAGADLDLKRCHPGDLDPHAVSSIFKSYLRELPSPLLTTALSPKFDAYVKARRKGSRVPEDGEATGTDTVMSHDDEMEDLRSLLKQLPTAHWFLLADVVKLLELIPRYHQVNRMTLNAVMLSLGPSLNIPGGVLMEMLEHRETLFASPPVLIPTESAESMLGFSKTNIPPRHLPAVPERQPMPASPIPEEMAHDLPATAKKSPRISSKPSFTRLFSGSSVNLSKKSSVETMRSSILDVTPPQVNLPTFETRLASFGAKRHEPAAQSVEHLKEDKALPNIQENKIDEPRVPEGTVEERAHLFSTTPTPIADMYQNSSSFPSLRSPKSSVVLGSSSALRPSFPVVVSESRIPRLGDVQTATLGVPANPASVLRRGPPVFFSSNGTVERHARLSSGSLKRKEDSPPLSNRSSGSEGLDPARVKRLSAGPGPMSVRETVRSMEMTA